MGGAGRGERQKGRRRRLSFYGFSSSFLLLFRDRFDLNYPPPPSSFSRPTFCCQLTHVTATFSPALGRLREKSQTASTGGGESCSTCPAPNNAESLAAFLAPSPLLPFEGRIRHACKLSINILDALPRSPRERVRLREVTRRHSAGFSLPLPLYLPSLIAAKFRNVNSALPCTHKKIPRITLEGTLPFSSLSCGERKGRRWRKQTIRRNTKTQSHFCTSYSNLFFS